MGRKNLKREDYAVHEVLAKKLNKTMVGHMQSIKAKRVAVLLSSGVDSHACLFAAMQAGKDVTCYSFSFRDKPSTDFRIARSTAQQFGLPFVPVELKRDPLIIKEYMLELFNNYSAKADIGVNKSSVECLWPLFTALERVKRDKQQATVIGFGGDVFFCTLRSQKKALLAGTYEEWKNTYYTNVVKNEGDTQSILLNEWVKQHNPGHKLVYPFHTKPVFDLFKGMHPFDPGCKPIQKAPVRLAFYDQMFRTDVLVHQSFQKGDSGISDHFDKTLITSNWNTRGLKSVKGIYNDLATGAISEV